MNPVTLPRPFACQLPTRSEPHSVLPKPQRNEYANRHRPSRLVGVSWPNDEDHDARAGDEKCGGGVRTQTTRSARARTINRVPSCACSRGRPLAKYSTQKSSDDLNPFTEDEEP